MQGREKYLKNKRQENSTAKVSAAWSQVTFQVQIHFFSYIFYWNLTHSLSEAGSHWVPGEPCVGTVLCSGVPHGSRLVDLNAQPSDHGATTLPTELSLHLFLV